MFKTIETPSPKIKIVYTSSVSVVFSKSDRLLGEFATVLPGHAITTLHYIIEKYASTEMANQTVDELLADFEVHPVAKTNFQRARQLPLKDFEDAVVAVVAEVTGSDYIVTRNGPDFAGSAVSAITPIEFLEHLATIEAG